MKVYFTKYQGKVKFKRADAIDILTKRYIVRIRESGMRITKCNGEVVMVKNLNLGD